VVTVGETLRPTRGLPRSCGKVQGSAAVAELFAARFGAVTVAANAAHIQIFIIDPPFDMRLPLGLQVGYKALQQVGKRSNPAAGRLHCSTMRGESRRSN
jgi:hypothetical protein